MAWRGGIAGKRRPNETPLEYQSRLLTALEAEGEMHPGKTPDEARILEELTQAYLLERYGEKRVEKEKLGYLGRWVPVLIKRMARRMGKKMREG
jgi:hypothetical protein